MTILWKHITYYIPITKEALPKVILIEYKQPTGHTTMFQVKSTSAMLFPRGININKTLFPLGNKINNVLPTLSATSIAWFPHGININDVFPHIINIYGVVSTWKQRYCVESTIIVLSPRRNHVIDD